MKNNNTIIYSTTGERHKRKNMKNQDYAFSTSYGKKELCILLDGNSKSDLASIESENIACIIADFLKKFEVKVDSSSDNEIKYNFITWIHEKLVEISNEKNIQIRELASTVIVLLIDNETERFMTLHLGDGAIAIKKNEKTVIISKPINGSDINETPLSVSDSALYYLQIKHGKCKDISKFLLVSDGVYKRFYDFEKLEKIMDGNLNDILSQEPEDDATFLIKKIIKSDKI